MTVRRQDERSRAEALVGLGRPALFVIIDHAVPGVASAVAIRDPGWTSAGKVRECDLHVEGRFVPVLRRYVFVPASFHPPLEPRLAVFAKILAGDATEGLRHPSVCLADRAIGRFDHVDVVRKLGLGTGSNLGCLLELVFGVNPRLKLVSLELLISRGGIMI